MVGTTSVAIPKPRRWFVYSTVGLFLFLAISLIMAALILMRKGVQPREAMIVGCSMEPTLRGRRLAWNCPECQVLHTFGADSIVEGVPLRCPRCNAIDAEFDRQAAQANESQWLAGDKVEYFPWRVMRSKRAANKKEVWDYQGLKRGDLVVLQEDESSIKEVKRIVGFPGETIEIRSGDLLVGGKRWIRTTSQILQQSVLLHYGTRQPQPLGVSEKDHGGSDTRDSLYAGKGIWSHYGEPWQFPFRLGAPLAPEDTLRAPSSKDDAEEEDESIVSNTMEVRDRVSSLDEMDHPLIDRIEFEPMHPLGICNDYIHNAHDSHQLLRVRDIGVAIQLGPTSESWELSVSLRSQEIPWQSVLEYNQGTLTIVSEGEETALDVFQEKSSRWLIVMCVDGMGIIATSEQDLLRVPLPSDTELGLEPSEMDTSSYPIALECKHGSISCDQWVVFRDIHYRGVDDQAFQRLEAKKGIVVLGDNVSLSGDSRQRWVDGLGTESIRGVVLPRSQGVEALLKQRP